MPEKRAVTQGIHAGPGSTVANVTQVVNVRPRDYYAPFQAPPLPPYFVPRPEVSVRLKAQLLAENEHPSGALVISAIHGLGGIGKSTLAAAMARDPDVLARFPDGILWATLGQQPDVLSILTGWIQALGDYDFRPTTAEVATAHLRTLLHNKAALLVVDDAWESGHVRPFLAGGDRCRALITTREAIIAGAVGADLYSLDVMTMHQALTLFEHRLGHRLEGKEKASAQELARIVGYLPLALKLAAAQVADGVSWDELLADLNAEITRLESLEPPEVEEIQDERERKYLSLNASFNLSLRRLPQDPRESFAWLGVLPEDVRLTPKMMATVWGVRIRKARDRLRYLRNKALLMPDIPLPDGTPTYRIHDLLHNLARRLLTAPPKPIRKGDLPGMGLTLQEANARLLERYRAQTRKGLWHTLPDDGYIYTYLTWHLEQAGQVEEIHALLQEETPEGRNGWYEARERVGQVAGFLADVERAWQLAFTPLLNNNDVKDKKWREGIRYALIISSFSSLAQNLVPALLVALVEKHIWSPAQGLTFAKHIPDVKRQAEALSQLSSHLSEDQLREALAIAQRMRDEQSRIHALTGLVPRLAKLGYPQEALSVTSKIKDEEWQAIILSKLAPYCPQRALVDATRKIEDERQRAETLVTLIPYLSEELLSEIRDIVKGISDKHAHVKALAALLSTDLPDTLKNKVLREAWDTTQEIKDAHRRAAAMALLVRYLPEPQREKALQVMSESAWEIVEDIAGLVRRVM